MIKKLIAASLSFTMLISTAAANGFNSLYADTRSKTQHDSPKTTPDTQLKGKNSFGKYIEKTASEEKNEGIRPLSLKADPESYKVAKLDFDLVSGKLTAVTSQSSACTLKISFINDDNENDVYEMTSPVSQGERCETVLSADKSMLPEFFKVSAVLTDVYGNELSETFSISKYMRFMQELGKATVEDYNEDYVVNLDNDDTTNFFVLSEETVIADSTDSENTLVSADYDNDVYVFDNINDSIRYLSPGDYFYTQPNEKDMVAVNIDSIDIDGDTATIRGGGDIDDMFDIIKIDVGVDKIDPSELEEAGNSDNIVISSENADEENDDYSVIYNGVGEDENGKPALEYSVLSYGDTNTPKSEFSLVGYTLSKLLNDGKKIKIPFEWKIGKPKKNIIGLNEKDEFGRNKVESLFKKELPIYKSFDKKRDGANFEYDQEPALQGTIGGEVDFSASIKVTFEANITYYKYKKEYEFAFDGYIEAKLEAAGNAKFECTFTMAETPITTPIPGLMVDLKGEVKIGIKASVTISAGIKIPFTIHKGNYGGGEDSEAEKFNEKNTFEIEGDFYFELIPSVALTLFVDVVVAKIEFPVKFNFAVKLFSCTNSFLDNTEPKVSGALLCIHAPENASKYEPLHACEHCIKIEPSITLKIKISFKVPLVKKMTVELAEKKLDSSNTSWLQPWHWSFDTKEIAPGNCDNFKYAADFHIIGNDEIKAQGLVVEVDNERELTGSGDTVCFFLKPDTWHNYKIYSQDELIKSEDFFIKPEYTKFDIDLDSGKTNSEKEAVVTTTTAKIEPVETHTVKSSIDTIINERPEHVMIEYGHLGDNVYYSLYPDGFLYISGYGPMNQNDDPIKNKDLVKNVLFEDYATYLKAEIAADDTNETLIDKYVEKYQDELSKLYLEKYKDDIVKALSEDYGVSADAPDLDEMIDDYIYANTVKLAREYYDRNTADFGSKLAEFKKELLSGLSDKVITTIGNNVFKDCENLESITYEGSPNEGKKAFDLPNTITAIGSNAFCNCKALDFGDVVLGDRVESIGTAAFENCYGLKTVRVPINVKNMGPYVFGGCSALTNAIIEADTDTLGIGTFRYCNNLAEITLPMSVKVKDEGSNIYYQLNELFADSSSSLRNHKVPNSLKKISLLRGDTINAKAFLNLGSLDIIALPQGIKHIKAEAFSFQKEMNIICSDETKKLTFSELFADLETVGEKAFINCKGLQVGDLVFGKNAKSIDMQAFEGVESIRTLYIPESVTWIGASAFENCSSMKKAVIKATASEYRGCLYGTSSLEELVVPGFIKIVYNGNGGKYQLDQLFNNNYLDHPSVKVPDSLKKISVLSGDKIPANAFKAFGNVETIGIPEGITEIGAEAFPNFSFTNLICSDDSKNLTFSELLKDVEKIGNSAFINCKNLEIGDLDLGDKLVSIGETAFCACVNIKSLHIPANVTSIGGSAFENCSGIQKVAIDTNIVLNEGILYGCPNIKELTLATINNTKVYDSYYKNDANTLKTIFVKYALTNPWTTIPSHIEKLTILSGETMPKNYLDRICNVDVLELPNELKFVDSYATHDLINSSTPTKVIYHGTEDEWDKIEIKDHNEPLEKSKVTFAPAEETKWITGDANGDGQIDMSDIVLIMQALANPDKYGINGKDPSHITAEGFKYADTDQNGLTVNDAANIQKFLLGINKTVSGK